MFLPPDAVREAARRGLDLHVLEASTATKINLRRAKHLSSGVPLSLRLVTKMYRFLKRHENEPKVGQLAVDWLLWGGDPGLKWVEHILSPKNNRK